MDHRIRTSVLLGVTGRDCVLNYAGIEYTGNGEKSEITRGDHLSTGVLSMDFSWSYLAIAASISALAIRG